MSGDRFVVLAWDSAGWEWVSSYPTREDARAGIARTRAELEAHPCWYDPEPVAFSVHTLAEALELCPPELSEDAWIAAGC